MKEICCIKCKKSINNLKSLTSHIFIIKFYFFLLFVTSVEVKIKQLFIQEESIEILKIHCLITNIEGYQKMYNHV